MIFAILNIIYTSHILFSDDLTKKIFLAQVESPLKNDWWLDVQSDLASFDIDMSFEEIKTMKKDSFSIGCHGHLLWRVKQLLLHLSASG